MIIFVRQGVRSRIRGPPSVTILKGLVPLLFLSRDDDKNISVIFRSASFVTTLDELPVKGNGRMTQNNESRWCLEDRESI